MSHRLTTAGVRVVNVRVRAGACNPYASETFDMMAKVDAVVIAFPLFTYSIPGGLTRLLEDYLVHLASAGRSTSTHVFAIVNCGFPDPMICREAMRVMRNFCSAPE